jgi:hypothetical protein
LDLKRSNFDAKPIASGSKHLAADPTSSGLAYDLLAWDSKQILSDSGPIDTDLKPAAMSTAAESEVSSHPTLKLTGIEQLKQPGSDFNYLDWSWILEIHFAATVVDYIITDKPEVARAKPNFARDNKAVCGIISRTIHLVNI